MNEPERKDVLNRLATIEGHLRGIRRMIEEDTYCIDVLKQTHAVQRAIGKLEDVLLQGHLASCVPTAFAEGRGSEAVAELAELFDMARR
ncbi:MAG: CsoR family transcriptional regulator, copper-sensing transcriptional repressor [Chloroflexota bacterium]|jgi:DNA-binding FrmR family transcriptional regulator|nr:CsoR family transcriptional regulator, copper-sensing transcriptional repressor [Chloroflexota bacterium]